MKKFSALILGLLLTLLVSGCLSPGGDVAGSSSDSFEFSLDSSVSSLTSQPSSVSSSVSSVSSLSSQSSFSSISSLSSVTSSVSSVSSSTPGVLSLATNGYYRALETQTAPVIDGNGLDTCWQSAAWGNISWLWMGSTVTASDFTGRFKMVWNSGYLFILAEITDDVLKSEANELANYWMGDCVEIFLDENHSGGDHWYNYNAFAYHISRATGQVYDIDIDQTAKTYDHIATVFSQSGTTTTWEMAVRVYGDNFIYGGSNTPVTLTNGKQLGFTMAYCDNDAGGARQSFIGSKSTHGINNDEGYTNASVFGLLELAR